MSTETRGQAHPLDLPAMAALAIHLNGDAEEAAEIFASASSIREQWRAIADGAITAQQLVTSQANEAAMDEVLASPEHKRIIREVLARRAETAEPECLASHCPPSMYTDCEWPKCAPVPQPAPGDTPTPEDREADRIIRDILESLCRRDGLPLGSSVVPGEPARNYDLALRLGIGHVFGIGEPAPDFRALLRDNLIPEPALDDPPQPAPELAAALGDWPAILADVTQQRDELRSQLDEIGVMAANAPEDGDSFGVLEEIAMRVAASGVPS